MTPSSHRIASIAAAVSVIALALALDFRRLDLPAPARAESELTAEARMLNDRGARDGDGRLLPVLWHGSGDRWFAPLPIYAGALALDLVASDMSPRIATVIAGTLGVALFYILVKRTFRSTGLGFAAAVLLLLTPAYLTFSRAATHDGIWLVPIAATWLLGLGTAIARPSEQRSAPIALCAATVMAGIYTQPSGALTMVLLTMLTAAVLLPMGLLTRRTLVSAAAAATLVGLPLAFWFVRYPTTYASTFGQWLLHPAHIRNPVDWARAVTNWNTLAATSQTYWDFFSPSHLLVNDAAPALAGVYTLPVGLLIVVGTRDVLRAGATVTVSSAVSRIALVGFIAVPLVAAAFKEPRAIDRALAMVPMGVLLAANGINVLWHGGPRRRAVAVLAVGAALIQSLVWYASVTSG